MEANKGKLTEWELTTYAWNYFQAHGQARLTTFRFYLIFCTILCAGVFGILANGTKPWIAGSLCLLQAFLSFIYWKVDKRHKELLTNAQRALMACESNWELADIGGEPHPLRLFTLDAKKKLARREKTVSDGIWLTYSQCVDIVFFVMGIGGLLGGVVLIAYAMI